MESDIPENKELIREIPLKDVKIGMCLAEPVKTTSGVVIFNTNFYFTSRNQIIKLLDLGVKKLKVNLGSSLYDDKTEAEKKKIIYDAKKEFEDPVKRIEKMTDVITETKSLFDQGEKVVQELMESARFGKALDKKSIRDETVRILDNIQKDPLVSLALLDLKNFDEYTYIHSINVAVLSVAFAHHLKFSEEKVLSIGQGGILHDIGKAKIPVNILNKPEKLNDTEFKVVQRHPNLGIQIVESEAMDNNIIKEIILHHHESYDGSGYPGHISGDDMKRYAAIVSVADFFDALTTKRGYKEIITPANAVKTIFSLKGKKFDPRVVNHFVKTVGIYPIGSIVELSDQRIATVIAFSKDFLLQPIVKVLSESGKNEIISLMNSDLYITGIQSDINLKTFDIYKK